jgi:hypothetical protein
MLVRLLLLATVFYASLAAPTFAEAAGWVLIRPPLDENRNPIPNAPVSSWGQMAAFDSAAQCEGHRMAEINGWESLSREYSRADLKEWLRQQWKDAFLLRCMPYDLWWRAQQARR